MWDFVSVVGTTAGRVTEFVDHLHEHFLDPCVVKNSHYMPPTKPGYSIEMKAASIADHLYPNGKVWQDIRANSSTAKG
jgi:L-fuconate dehydratase